tara:strand:- start:1213 stop:1587 length:375 start_codon:yes stop_codon:yes gene_type:complete
MKKNYDYIASVEKAIAEKYGKDSVQDFRSSWDENKEKDYLDQLSQRSKRTEEKQISGHKKKEPTCRTCPICKTYSFSGRDDLYMNRFKACYKCYSHFILQSEDRWNDGWRPTKEQIADSLRRRK